MQVYVYIREEEEAVDDPRLLTCRGLPHLRHAPDLLLYLFHHSSDEECVEPDEEYTPPTKQRMAEDHFIFFHHLICKTEHLAPLHID